MPAYLVLGRNKFDGVAESFDGRQDEIDGQSEKFKVNLDPWRIEPGDAPSWHEAIRRLSELELTHGNSADLLINGKGDSQLVFLATFHYIYELRNLGIRFYAYKPGFLHEKVMLIDDNISTVGTHNFDNRSFRLNFEVTSIIVDEEFAAEMETMFEQDFLHAEPIDPNTLKDKSIWWRIGVRLSRLASPVL